MKSHNALLILAFALILGAASAQQCGRQANGALCPNGFCCSQFGFCGNTDQYCKTGCQSQCGGGGSTPTPAGSGSDVGGIITQALYNQMLKYSNDARCPSNGFYTYNAFITATRSFPAFGTTGDVPTRKKELAAFFGQTSHETTGGWPTAPDGPYAWGYCFIRERNQDVYCTPSQQWPCAAGQKYYGRGPIQLTHNYNYGPAGNAIRSNLLATPDLVATDAVIAFKTAIWFWMTPQGNKPSCHDVITGRWQPSGADNAAGRVPGYGVITNIINGGLECGRGPDARVADRIGFYKRGSDAIVVYKKMKEEGLEPDVVTFNTLIFGLSKSGRVKEARQFLDIMAEMGHFPDAVTYTSLMNGMCCKGDALGALSLLEEMEEKGCSPNSCTYNTLLHGLAKSRLLDRGIELYGLMKTSDMMLETASYATFVRALCRSGRIAEAYEVFDYAVESKSLTDVAAYLTLESTLKSLKKAREQGQAI